MLEGEKEGACKEDKAACHDEAMMKEESHDTAIAKSEAPESDSAAATESKPALTH